MTERGKWQGMVSIARFNWPFYAGALVVLIVSIVGLFLLPSPLGWLCALPLLGCLYFLVGSLGVSHLIYDRSDIYRFRWLDRALAGAAKDRIISCHSGFDETSGLLHQHLPETSWRTLDHFDAFRMTEPSIHRARGMYPPIPGTLAVLFDHWPVEDCHADAILGILAIHEFRSEAERAMWFDEASRCLKPGGRIVIAEHVRDLANFLAFGPGFLHFHSVASWRRSWEAVGLRCADTFRVTPWVRIFVITGHD